MSETTNNTERVIMNEYLEIEAKQSQLELVKDCYHALGWTIAGSSSGIGKITLRLARDRKIKNREKLQELQKNCENAFRMIDQLEDSKTTKAAITAMSVGVAGTVFMAGSVFAYLGGMLPLSILLAVPGFIGWGLPYLLYKKGKRNSTAKAEPMIAHNYDIIYEACEIAAGLLR